MSLVRWDPMTDFDSLHREVNRLFDSVSPLARRDLGSNGVMPALELEETETDLQIKLELPGFEAKDMDIQVTEDAVTVTGERKHQSESDEKGIHRTEFRYGKYHRVIPLPAKVMNRDAKADYTDGILHLTLPKSPTESKVHRVQLS